MIVKALFRHINISLRGRTAPNGAELRRYTGDSMGLSFIPTVNNFAIRGFLKKALSALLQFMQPFSSLVVSQSAWFPRENVRRAFFTIA
jgi:hypothetical protein